MKIMSVYAVLLALFPFATQAADHYTFDPAHTNIDWRASHFDFSYPTGKFAQATGTLLLDEKNPAKSSLDVEIDINKLATGIEKFDEHLKSKDFLDAATYPTAKFVSTNVKVTGAKTADIIGDLTLHGVTKPVTLKATLNKVGPSAMSKKKTAGFAATGTIKRSDFGITMAIPGVSDEIALTIAAEANLDEVIK